MEGTVQWAVLIFMGMLVLGSMGIAWAARGILAANAAAISHLSAKVDTAVAALSNAVTDRNFLIKYDLTDTTLRNDLEHLKNNFKLHQVISGEMHDDLIRLHAEVTRLGKIVNGKN